MWPVQETSLNLTHDERGTDIVDSNGKKKRKSWAKKRKSLSKDFTESPREFFRRLDLKVLGLSERVGSDNTKKHPISFWLYLPTEDDALSLAKELPSDHYEVEVNPPIGGSKDWLCLAYRTMVPDPDELEKIRERLTKLALLHNGEFDGWEMEIPWNPSPKLGKE